MTSRLVLTTAVAVLLLAVTFERVHADDPVSTSVAFNREIIRIVQRKCEPCHVSGGLAMSLSTYQSARSWGRAIREELVEHRMPPAVVARGYGHYETDPSLTAREMAVFLAWLDGGMPRGSDADLPPRIDGDENGEELEDPAGLRLPLPAQTVPAREPLVVRRVTIDAGAAAGRAVARVQFRPGNRRVLRGALVYAAPAGQPAAQWLGGWLPWQHAVVPPQGYAFTLPARGTLIVDLYYRGSDADTVDRSTLDLSFAPPAATGRIDDLAIEAAPAAQRVGQAGVVAHGRKTLSQPTTIWALQPEIDASVSSMELRAERPDKSVEVLLWIPKASVEWPLALVLQQPVHLPAGSTLSLMVEHADSARQGPAPRVWVSALR